MRREDEVRIRHMIDAADAAARFVTGRSRSDLDTHEMLRFALIRAVEIIGEAASKVTAETRTATPSVLWFAIVAMRNRLIHAYFDVDPDILWKTVTEEIPQLRAQLLAILPDEPAP